MRTFLTASVAAATFLAFSAAADTPSTFGRADGLSQPSLSPSGNLLAVECAPQGAPAVCIFDIVKGGDSIFIPIGSGYRLQRFYWANENFLLINVSQYQSLQTVEGQQQYDFQRTISYDIEKKSASLLMKDEGNLLDTQNVVSVLPDDDQNVLVEIYVYVASNASGGIGSIMPEDREGGWTLSTHKANLRTGKARKQKTFGSATLDAWYDKEGDVVAELVKSKSSDRVELKHDRKTLYSYSTEGVTELFVYDYDEATGKLVVFRDVGDQDGLYYMSLDDGTLEPISIDGSIAGRAEPIEDTYTRGIVGFRYFDGLDQQVFIDPVLKGVHAQLSGALPDKRVNLVSWNAAKTKIAISATSPGRPADFYVFDKAAGQLGPVGNAASHLVEATVGAVSAETIAARDGLQMEVIVTLPPGKTKADGPFPTLIMPHGGPESRDGLEFDWQAQAYAAEGYMVLQPNFRGSSGYGQAFRNAGFGEFGGKMIDDIADAGAWAIGEGLVAENAYCVTGASYGGYASLMIGLKDAGNSRCIVSVNGVTQPFALIGHYSDDSEGAEYWERYLGANRYSSDEERAPITPLSRAGEFTQPVLLLYGEQDLVVPSDQTTRLAQALAGKANVKAVSLGQEDHFTRTSDVRNKVLSETLAFFNEHHPARGAPGGE
ncbi:MAG: prolyl oligopeptidase family serine peptidase [Henriciella sp.]